MLLYHLDRANSLPVNGIVALEPFISYNPPETLDILSSLFKDGVSYMGQKYLNLCYYSDNVSVNTFNIEYIFESVRRNYFSHLPSRFTSLFAVEALEELKQWYLSLSFNKTSLEHASIKVIDVKTTYCLMQVGVISAYLTITKTSFLVHLLIIIMHNNIGMVKLVKHQSLKHYVHYLFL